MNPPHAMTFFAAACLLLLGAAGCTSDSDLPGNDGGADVAVDTSIDVADVAVDTSIEAASPTVSCPLKQPSGTAPIACDAPSSLVCQYVLVHCPGHHLGEFYEYERAMYKCEGGIWQYKGQDCYDCCRGFPLDGGGNTMLPGDAGTDATTD